MILFLSLASGMASTNFASHRSSQSTCWSTFGTALSKSPIRWPAKSSKPSARCTRSLPLPTKASQPFSMVHVLVKMSFHKDIPSVLRVGAFDCRVWYRRQPVLCSICDKAGHRAKQCPLNGLCRRCKKLGHMVRECRNAWGTAESSAASGSSGSRAAPPSAPPAPRVPMDTALLLSAHLVEEDDMDTDYRPLDEPEVGPISSQRTHSMGNARPPAPTG